MSMSRAARTSVVAALAIAAVVTAATPASAAASPAAFDVDVYLADKTGYGVAAHCVLAAGYTTDPRFITYVVHASAHSTGPSVPVATSVQCTVFDAIDSSRTYGGASGAMPGPRVESLGQATVPVGRIPAVCVRGGATFLDGTTIASTKSCP